MNLNLICFRSWSASARSPADCFQWRSRRTGRTSTKSQPLPSALARTTIGAHSITSTSESSPAESTRRMRYERTVAIACDRPPYVSQQLVLWSGAPKLQQDWNPRLLRSTFLIGSCSQLKNWTFAQCKSPPAGPGARICFSSCDMQDNCLRRT